MSATFIATAAEAYLRQALAELRGLDERIGATRSLAPGVIHLTTSLDRGPFLARLHAKEPVFVRHIHPVDSELMLKGSEADLEALEAACGPLLSVVEAGQSVAVQVRRVTPGEAPYSRSLVRERLDALVAAAGARPMTQDAQRILSVVLGTGVAYVGLSTPEENLSDWPGGEIRFKREPDQLSRAKFKLLEAFETFDVPIPEGGHALDLGAAPGGWTSLLLELGLRVTAVDTGELAPALLAHPGLTFLRENVEEVRFPSAVFDLVTCDMSWNPLNTARMVSRLAPSVRPGAHLILTVKLMLQNPTRTIRLVGEALGADFRLLKVKQLFHNRDEVTMQMVRK